MKLVAENGSACRPPPGNTFLAIGQDFFSIQEYIQSQYNTSLHRTILENNRSDGAVVPAVSLQDFVPAAVMTYTDIHKLQGLTEPADYGSGIEYTQGLVEAFPHSALQIGLWLNGTSGCQDILDGKLDSQIHALFDFIGRQSSIPKVFLRVGYEFDNPWFGFSDSPSTYQAAFRQVVADCERQLGRRKCHTKVAFVWHSWAAPRTVPSLNAFYPGNDVVDWVGVSIFQQLYPWANARKNDSDASNTFAGGSLEHVKEVLDFAKANEKPIMIAESTPYGGIHVAATGVAKGYFDDSSSEGQNGDILWELWYQKTIDLIERYDISMWSYINCDWDSQPMWRGIGFGDTRISSSRLITMNWWEHVMKKPTRFLNRIQCKDSNIDADTTHFPSVSTVTLARARVFDTSNHNFSLRRHHMKHLLLASTAIVIVMTYYWHRRIRGQQRLLDSHQRFARSTSTLYGSMGARNYQFR
ncbi:cellulase H protein [Nitzschia inconspicua]|uniref:Cellulase H protein n=1 Tax=Nitzschia inconspicua TaxID=303405 RepID=A0A9K3KR61_9STRA|nr:cellulase H protein [Nitzschia inconspicua]